MRVLSRSPLLDNCTSILPKPLSQELGSFISQLPQDLSPAQAFPSLLVLAPKHSLSFAVVESQLLLYSLCGVGPPARGHAARAATEQLCF